MAGQTSADSTGIAASGTGKKPWQDPKLSYVEPKLASLGRLTDVTNGFFGTFSPPSDPD